MFFQYQTVPNPSIFHSKSKKNNKRASKKKNNKRASKNIDHKLEGCKLNWLDLEFFCKNH
jgi:hypothetical protein